MSITLRSPEPEPQPELGRHITSTVSSQEQLHKSLYTDADGIHRAQIMLGERQTSRYDRLSADERYDASDSITLAMARHAVRLGMIYIHEQDAYRAAVPTIMTKNPVWFEPHSSGMARGRWDDELEREMMIEVDASTDSERAILLSGVTALARYLSQKD